MKYLIGSVEFQSELSIFDVSNLISEKVFSGLKFEGFEESIYEEIPALYIKSPILGTKIVLSGTKGFSNDDSYLLDLIPVDENYYLTSDSIDIKIYLEDLFQNNFDFKIIR